MDEYLTAFCEGLNGALGEHLVSIILYGSAARAEEVKKFSDANVMVVLKEFSLKNLSAIEKIVRRAERKANLSAVFWTEEELKRSADVFPIEFLDIQENHKILSGKDVFWEISVDRKNLRHQIEFELRSKLLRLRSEWLNVKGSRGLLFHFLARAGTSFLYLFNHSQGLFNGKLNDSLSESFKNCIRLKKGELKLGTAELENLYEQVHDSAVRMIAAIDSGGEK